MTERSHLAAWSSDPLTRAVLAAGQAEQPSDEARRNAAIAIGLAAGLATATSGGALGTASGTAAASKWFGIATILKVVGATVAGGALVVGVVRHEQADPPDVSPAPSARVATAHPAARPRPFGAVPRSSTEEAVTEAVPASPVAAVASSPAPPLARTAVRAAPRASPPRPEATLREEVEWLDRARAALARGDGAAARADVDAYERAIPKGVLRDEAELVRIEAAIQTRDFAIAEARANELLARDEHGPLARRLRALLASLASRAGAP